MTAKEKESGSPKRLTEELKAWLRGRKGWNHDEWLALLADLRSKGFTAFTESQEGRDSIGVFLSAYLPVVTQLAAASPQQLKNEGEGEKDKCDLNTDKNKPGEGTGQTGAGCPAGNAAVMPEEVAAKNVEASKWYRQSAEQGLASGRNELGHSHEHGEGVVVDRVNAVKWFLN